VRDERKIDSNKEQERERATMWRGVERNDPPGVEAK